jgi:hypothetical protein
MKKILLALSLSSFACICFGQVPVSVIDLKVDGPSFNGKTVVINCPRIYTGLLNITCEWQDGKQTASADQASMDKVSLRNVLTNCGNISNSTCKGTMTGVFVYNQFNPLITRARLSLN